MKKILLGLITVLVIFSFIGCYGTKGEELTPLQMRQAEQATVGLFVKGASAAGTKKPAKSKSADAIDERISSEVEGTVALDSPDGGSASMTYKIAASCGMVTSFSYNLTLDLNDYIIANVPIVLEDGKEATNCNVKFKGSYVNNFEIGFDAGKLEGFLNFLFSDKNKGLAISMDTNQDGTYDTKLPVIYTYIKYDAKVNKDGFKSKFISRINKQKPNEEGSPLAGKKLYTTIKSVAY